MGLKMEISQKQVLSQRMVQSMEILQMSTQELESYIENLALENPVIEFPESYSAQPDNKQAELQRKIEWLESTDQQNKVYYQQEHSAQDMQQNWSDGQKPGEELSDYLFSQLLLADYGEKEKEIVEFLVFSLDERGYFTDGIASVAERFQVSEEMIESLLKDIQSLDPAGVGARDLTECLLLQLDRKKEGSEIARAIVCDYMGDVAKNHLSHIARKLSVSVDEVMDTCDLIRTLNPKPGNSFSSREQLRYISPDVVIVKLADQFEILINEYQYPQFTISGYYQKMLQETQDEEAKKYLQEKIQQAEWVSNCIGQRSSTLSRIMHSLVEKQYDFFCYGIGHKRPLKLADLAQELGIHESTVSRAMRGKYLQCSWGVFPLNYFLTSVAVKSSRSGEEKTPEQIKDMIRQIVESEDKKKPYSDQAISDRLKECDIRISRRTVNKYRVEMGLPDKSGRKIS